MEQAAVPQGEILTVDLFAQKHRSFKPGGLRWLIFHETSNGLKESGAILRVGRRVLIDEVRFFAWLREQQRIAPLEAA